MSNRILVFLFVLASRKGWGQNLTSPSLCTPIEHNHPCASSVDIPSRNSDYRYPQLLPEDAQLSGNSVRLGFLFVQSANPPADPDCASAIYHIMCLAARPPCDNSTDLLLPICPDSCLAYNRIIEEGKCTSLFEYVQTLISSSQGIDILPVLLDLLLSIDCFNLSSYYFYNETYIGQNNQCTDLFSVEDKERIISEPNQCVPTPSEPTICDTTMISQYNHYIPLESRNVSHNLQLSEGLTVNDNIDVNCTNILISLACFATFPPCDPNTGEALPLCPEDCEATNELVWPCIANSTSESELANLGRMLNCSDADSYLPSFVHVSDSMCISGTILGENAEPSKTGGELIAVGVIAGATVGAVAVLIILGVFVVVGVVFLTKRRSREVKLLGYSVSLSLRKSERTYTAQPGSPASDVQLEAFSEKSDLSEVVTLSEADRQSYKKVFSSILIPYASLTVGEVIGQGAFGKVCKGEIKRTSRNGAEPIAIKTIKNLTSRNELEAFFAESLLMKDFQHPNILGLTGVCFDTPDGVPFIILPFMANGSLKDYLKRKRTHVTNVNTLPEGVTFSLLVQMCLDIANGMEYLAEKKFVHRDLAARNCMVDSSLMVKVGDFGLARDIYSSDYYRANAGARLPVKWMAPETLHDAISNEKTDVWSFGVTCWEVFSLGRSPYPGIENQNILKHIETNNERLERPALCPKMLFDLTMGQCWKLLPEERPTFSQLAHQLQEYWEEEHAYVVEDTEDVNRVN